jgi:hypothetical protein
MSSPTLLIPKSHEAHWQIGVNDRENKVCIIIDHHGRRDVLELPLDRARRFAGAVNHAAQELLRRQTLKRGDIVGPL